MQENNLKKVEIDEIELYYSLLKTDINNEINDLTCKEIAHLVEVNFEVICTERDIFLLHEPTISEEILDSEIHYNLLFN